MSVIVCIIQPMQTTWTKYTYTCDPDECDAMIEFTCRDGFGFPSGSVNNITCPCGRKPNMVSVENATIQPLNERKQMETVSQELYNPHAFIAVRRIDSTTGDNTYPIYKATDVEEVLNRINLLEQRIEHQEKQLGQIIDNLSVEGWYSKDISKEEVLRDLCSILDHNPQQELSWSVTVTVEGTTLVNLDEVEDFDIKYHLDDNLSIDSNDFDTRVDSWHVYDVDSQDWQ